MHEYGAYDWSAAVRMPLVRVFALHSVAAVRHGMSAAAPSYGERERVDSLVQTGSRMSDKLIIIKGEGNGRRIQGRRKPR